MTQRARATEDIRPQQMPRQIRPKTLGELLHDERHLELALTRMEQYGHGVVERGSN